MDADGHPDIGGLRRFAATGDRRPAPFFVGRDDVIADIEGMADASFESWRLSEPGSFAGETRLIQGAPGAGKTALLAFLARRWTRGREVGRSAPVAVEFERRRLESLPLLLAAVANAVEKGAGDELFPETAVQTGVSAGALGVSVSAGRSSSVRPLRTWETLARRFEGPDWTHPVCLMIDEVQNLTEAEAGSLEELHKAVHGLPVFAVLAGLAWSRERLQESGISRFASGAVHVLPSLGTAEAERSAGMFMEHYRVSADRERRALCARSVAVESRGWPQHLHNALRALAMELAAPGIDGVLNRVDLDRVADASLRSRMEYYRRGIRPGLAEAPGLLAAAAAAVPEAGIHVAELKAAIASVAERAQGPGDRLPEKLTASGFVDEMVRSGILHRVDGVATIPIPSFRRFLMDRGRRPLTD